MSGVGVLGVGVWCWVLRGWVVPWFGGSVLCGRVFGVGSGVVLFVGWLGGSVVGRLGGEYRGVRSFRLCKSVF